MRRHPTGRRMWPLPGGVVASFDELKGWLIDWYDRGDSAAAAHFLRHWLLPTAQHRVGRLRLPATEREDFVQELVSRFMHREEAAGRAARGLGFWRRWLQMRGVDLVRRRQARLRHEVLVAGDEVQPGDRNAASASDPAQRLVIQIDLAGELARLKLAVARLPPRRRVFFAVSVHPTIDLISADDLRGLQNKTGRPIAELREALDRLDGDAPSRELLPLLFAASEIDSPEAAQRALDTYRQGRARALRDVQASLATAGEAIR